MFAGSPDGGFIFPDFIAGFDAVMSLAKVLELLALEDKPLSELCDEVPTATLIHERAPVPWSLKGLVMRELSERIRENRVDLADGIRVEDERRLGPVRARPRRAASSTSTPRAPTSDDSAELLRALPRACWRRSRSAEHRRRTR